MEAAKKALQQVLISCSLLLKLGAGLTEEGPDSCCKFGEVCPCWGTAVATCYLASGLKL